MLSLLPFIPLYECDHAFCFQKFGKGIVIQVSEPEFFEF
jgi:hypothetical protein